MNPCYLQLCLVSSPQLHSLNTRDNTFSQLFSTQFYHTSCMTLCLLPFQSACTHFTHSYMNIYLYFIYTHLHVCVNIYKLFRQSLPLLSTLSLHHSRLLLLRLPSFIQAAGAKTLKSFSLSSWLHWDAFQEPSEIPGPLAESKQRQAKRLPSWLPQHLLDTLEILITSHQIATFKTHLRQNHQIAL